MILNQFASTPSYSSGAGERFYYLCPFFKEAGIKTRVVSGGYNHLFVKNPATPKLFNDEKVDGGLFTWVKIRTYNKASFLGRFLSWIEFFLKLFLLKHKDRPNVVLVSSMSLFPIIYAFWLRLRFKSKVILEVRDIWPLTPMELGGYSKSNPFILIMSILEKWSYRKADGLVSVLPDFDQHVENVLGMKKKVSWIPNAIDKDLALRKDRLNEDLKTNKALFKVIYTGALGIANAMDVVIDAANELKDYKDIQFEIIGEGPEKQVLMDRASEFGLENIEFRGKVTKDQVAAFLEQADLALISWNDSKLYQYGVSANKYNDYMLAGLPIISSSNIASDPVLKANCGVQVPAHNYKEFAKGVLAVKALSMQERCAMGKNGMDYVLDNQVYDAIAKSYTKLIKGL